MATSIAALPNTEVHGDGAAGRLVVVCECASADQTLGTIALAKRYWQVLRRPSVHHSLGFLTIGGILFWSGFNTALEMTNTEQFCFGCHEMHDNVYQELQGTVHFTNRSAVRAHPTSLERGERTCIDCHAGIAHRMPDISEVEALARAHGGQKALAAIISGEKVEEQKNGRQ